MNQVVTLLMLAISLGVPVTKAADGPMISPSVGPGPKVKIEVVAQEQLKNDIYRNMTQALASLANAQLVEENPDWTIEVVTLTLQDQEGNPTAVALSVVVLKHGPQMKMLQVLAKAWRYVVDAGLLEKDQPLEVGMRELLMGVEKLPKTDSLTVVSQHRMCLIPVQKLGEACHDTIVNFTTRFLDESKIVKAEKSTEAETATPVSVASATQKTQ